jgi:hypothetical protein
LHLCIYKVLIVQYSKLHFFISGIQSDRELHQPEK